MAKNFVFLFCSCFFGGGGGGVAGGILDTLSN